MSQMDVNRKYGLMKKYVSYWNTLPKEMQEYVLEFKFSQEHIEAVRVVVHRQLCREIMEYQQLKEEWGLGSICCKVKKCNACTKKPFGIPINESNVLYLNKYVIHVRIYGMCLNEVNVKKSKMSGYNFVQALSRANHVKSFL